MTDLNDVKLFEQLLMISAIKNPTDLLFFNSQEDEDPAEIMAFTPNYSFGITAWPVELFGRKFHIIEHFIFDMEKGRVHYDRFKDRDLREFWPEYFTELLAGRETPARWEKSDWRGLTEDQYGKILDLILAERAYPLYGVPVALEKDGVPNDWYMAVMCSDTFMYACTDSQICYPDKIDEVHEVFKRWGRDGTAAWCGVQRGWTDPIAPADTPEYRAAENWLLEKEKEQR